MAAAEMNYDTRLLSETVKRLTAEQTELSAAVLRSPAEDFAGYQRKVGEYYGINKALEILEKVVKDLG